MTSPSLKQVFTYDADGFYADGSIAQRNPQNPDEWLFPQDCTTVAPADKKGVFFKIKNRNDVNSGWDEIPYPSSAAELVGVQISHTSRTAHDHKMRQILQQLVAAEPELYKEVAVNDESGNKIATTVEEIPQPTEEEKRNPVVCSDMTVADCVRRWLIRMRRRVDEVTYRSYQHTAETHILPYFDENRLKLCDCTVEVLQTYFDEKYRNGRKDGKGGLSSKTMRHHKGILGQALAECVKDGLIPSNPCQYVEMPRRERHEAHFYSAEQLQQLITALNGDPIQPLVKIAALYGLRRSELLGLKWDSIDFENGMVLIRHTVCKMIVTVEKDKTKTQSSRRSFPMTEEAREIFLKAKAEEEENQRLFGKAYQKNDYVFKWPDGRTFAPDYVTHHFSKMLERYGMPHIRFHELRHSCASLLLNNGCGLKDVQEWMGHSDIQTTANIYGHLDTSRKQSLADKLTECLNERC